jgi:hypothetical protein
MSKLTKALLVGAGMILGLSAAPIAASAADLQVPPPAAVHAASCGPCGCLHVTWDYHREVLSTYGPGFDPRNFDTAEPIFYLGRVRAYPHYWCELDSTQ